MYRAETGAGRFHELAPPDTAVSARGQQHEVPWRLGVAVIVILGLLSLSVWAVLKLRSGPEKPPPIPISSTEESATTAPDSSGEPVSPAADPATKPAAKYVPFTVKVTVASNGASWIEAKVDGKSAYVGSLTGGHSKSFEVTRKAVLKIGRASVVTVYRDGEPIAVPDNGGTPTLTLTAKPAP